MITPAAIYVDCAIAVIKMAHDEADLIKWWKGEKPNREKYRLSPTQFPGEKLKQAFDLKRTQLKGTSNGTF